MKSKKNEIEKIKKESIKNQALKSYQKDVDTERWTCAVCASKGAGQPAAIVRALRQEGYKFEEVTKGQWSKSMMCNKCGKKQSHYKLLSKYPVNDENKRYAISDSDTKRLKKILGNRDVFTDTSSRQKLEIDHKCPFTIAGKDIKISNLTDDQVRDNFQHLTPDHNKLKNFKCQQCKREGIRPAFMGIKYWYEGDKVYKGTCVGCGWYDTDTWREHLNSTFNLN